MAESAEEFIERKSHEWKADRDRPVMTRDISGEGTHVWLREAWTWHIQGNYGEKALLIERLRHQRVVGRQGFAGGAGSGDIEYRIGYYIVSHNGRTAGRWIWGRFTPLIPAVDLEQLLDRARREGTILPTS